MTPILSISIPSSVQIIFQKKKLFFLGPLGISVLNLDLNNIPLFFKKSNENELILYSVFSGENKAFLNTIITLIKEKLRGISRGYIKQVSIVGIGYRVAFSTGQDYIGLKFKLGFSNEILYFLPKGIQVFRVKPEKFYLFSNDLQLLTSTCARIKKLKKIDPYKGKGIRYKNEVVKLRIGKRK